MCYSLDSVAGTSEMISEKQKQILAFKYTDYDALICDGAIRSGKTTIGMVAFVDWAMEFFSGYRFGICGKTVGSAIENIVVPYISMSYAKKKYILHWRRSQKILEVRRGRDVNYFEVFGGKDESSYALIQGRTLAGVLLDEVVLMPQSFVNQALARCSVEGARYWFFCNPEGPRHWFKQKWIDGREEHNALRLHFTLDDNPSLSEKKKEQYSRDFTGVFYDRYVLGKWVLAEGLVYPMFSEELHLFDELPWMARQRGKWYISLDYGTVNPTAAGLWCLYQGNSWMVQEYYYDSRDPGHKQLTDEEHYSAIEKLAGDHKIERIIVDPSAASFKACIRRHGRFPVWDADNAVIDGIRLTGTLLQAGRLKIHKSCDGIIGEFGQYSWDQDATEDTVIKDCDHAMDQMRYFCATVMAREVRSNGV